MSGAPEKLGVVGADSPAEAENLIRQIASMHHAKQESVELCILQTYRAYPAHLLTEIFEAQRKAEIHAQRAQNSLNESSELQAEIRRLRAEISDSKKTPTKHQQKSKAKWNKKGKVVGRARHQH